MAVYAVGFFLMFGFSFAYNMAPASPVKWFLRRCDHSAIYLMIAGTYTALLSQIPDSLWAIALAVFVWSGALVGVTLNLLLPGRFDRVAVGVYLALGWSAIVAIRPLVAALPALTLTLVVVGGVIYSVGVAFLSLAQPEIPERDLARLCRRRRRLPFRRHSGGGGVKALPSRRGHGRRATAPAIFDAAVGWRVIARMHSGSPMTRTRFAFALAALGLAGPALAAELPTQSSLPSLAADPGTQAPDWKGFYVGTGVSVVSFKGEKGAVGGDVFAGYDRTFDNNLVLGVRFSTGYNPWLFPGGLYHGFDFAATSVKLGYEMGRLTPYVVTGVASRDRRISAAASPTPTIRSTGCSPVRARCKRQGPPASASTMPITNNVHVGLEATVGNLGPYGAFGALGH